MKLDGLLGALGLAGHFSLSRPEPTAEELEEFEAECRRADLPELGHLLFTARTDQHARIAEQVIQTRLPNQG